MWYWARARMMLLVSMLVWRDLQSYSSQLVKLRVRVSWCSLGVRWFGVRVRGLRFGVGVKV